MQYQSLVMSQIQKKNCIFAKNIKISNYADSQSDIQYANGR